MKYPKSTFFILTCAFFEKFGYFGIRTILPLYFVDVLLYSENSATIMYHAYSMFIYIFSLLGAAIADSWLGKFRTILVFGIFYITGELLLAASSVPTFGLPVMEISMLSLLLITLGVGAIKPCVVAIGGDEFQLPEQEAQLKSYFSIFYFFINAGSLLGILITPVFRKDITCYGRNACYPLAAFFTALLTIACIAVLFAGRKMYSREKPEGNIIGKVTKCIYYGMTHQRISNRKRDHWLDNADDKFDPRLINDTKYVLNVLKLFIPVPFYWALLHQQGSRWTFQATRMDGEVFGYLIKPDQFQVVNPIMLFVLIPMFHFCILPILEKFLFIDTALKKMTVGGILASAAFFAAGFLELNLEKTYPIQPSNGLAQIRIFNTINCNASVHFGNKKHSLEALDFYQNLSIPANGSVLVDLKVHYENCPYTVTQNHTVEKTLKAQEAKALSWFLTKDGISSEFQDKIEKSKSGDPKFRALIYTDTNTSSTISLKLHSRKNSYIINTVKDEDFTNFTKINHNVYEVSLNNKVVTELLIRFGGVYSIIGYVSDTQQFIKLLTLAEPNSVHMLWLLPQNLILAVSEIMFAITGLEFAYSQAPASMKSVIISCWCLTVSGGDIIVMIIAKLHFFDRQVFEFFLFATLMIFDILIFAIMAKFYKYANFTADENVTREKINLQIETLLNDNL